MKVFAALGLDRELAETAFRPQAIEARMGRSGLELFQIPLTEYAVNRWGAPYLHIHRADYIAVLTKALQTQSPGALHLGAEVTRYNQTEDAVEVRLADERQISGDVLIGADGIHSPCAANAGHRKADIYRQCCLAGGCANSGAGRMRRDRRRARGWGRASIV